MNIRKDILKLMELGRLPDSIEDDNLSDEEFQTSQKYFDDFQKVLDSIEKPITVEEAKKLILLFPNSDCYGMEGALLHLIESTPNWPIWEIIDMCPSSEWKKNMKERAGNS